MALISEKLMIIKKLVKNGKYSESLKKIENIVSISGLDIEDYIRINSAKVEILINISQYKQAYDITNRILKESKKIKNKLFIIDSLNYQLESLFPLGDTKKSKKIIKKGKKVFNKIKINEKDKGFLKKKAKFLFLCGIFFEKFRRIDDSLKNYNESLEIRKKINDKKGIASSLLHIGNLYRLERENQISIEFLSESLKYSTQNGINMCSAWAYAHIANIHRLGFQLEETQKNANQALKISIELNNSHCEDYASTILGEYNLKKGNYSKALEFFNRCLELRKKRGDLIELAYINHSISKLYRMKGDLEKSEKYMDNILGNKAAMNNPASFPLMIRAYGLLLADKGEYHEAIKKLTISLKYFYQNNDPVYIIETLNNLINLLLYQNNLTNINDYLQQSEEIYKHHKNHGFIYQIHHFNKALILKNSTRLKDKIMAQSIFYDLVSQEMVDSKITIESMLNLLELLIFELEHSGEIKILQEIKVLSDNLIDIALHQQSILLYCEILFFKAKLSLIELKLEDAQRLLIEAKKIANKNNYIRLASNISIVYSALIFDIDKWESYKHSDKPLKDLLQQAKSDFFFSRMLKKSNMNIDDSAEIPVFFVIWADEGLDLFTMIFNNNQSKINKRLISGFLTAFDLFGKKTLLSSGSIDRIKHGEFTIIIRVKENLRFSYGFKGNSLNTIKKLINFIDQVSTKNELWNDLIQAESTKKPISSLHFMELKLIADNIFFKL